MTKKSHPNRARLASYFTEYAAYHSSFGNQVCHFFGIPMIMVSLLGMLSHWVISRPFPSDTFQVDGGTLFWLLATGWYLLLDWRIAVPFSLVSLGGYFLGRAIPLSAAASLFLIGWVIQFVGHYRFEGKSPAFFRNALHLLIGPFWIFCKVIGFPDYRE